MSAHPRSHRVNPRLGIYFGIYTSAVAALVLMLIILEQLGMSEPRLRNVLALTTLGTFAVIGGLAFTQVPSEFFLAGRRVPASFVGMSMAVASIGGTGLVTFSGAMFLAGFDALCVPLGILAGFVAMVVLIAPYVRKFGAFTVPGYLGMRFESPAVRIAAASAASASLLLLIIAEIKIAALAMGWLVDLPQSVIAMLLVAAIVITVAPGGLRSLSWSGAAQSLVALAALVLPVTIVSVMETNLPLGQVSHGPVLRAIGRLEYAQGLPAVIAGPLTFELPGQAVQTISGRFATPFSSVGSAAFVLAMLCVMLGIAGSPAHLGRAATTPSVYEARKSIGWSVFLVGVVIMTLSAIAVFFRERMMTELVGLSPDALPQTFRSILELGFAAIDAKLPALSATTIAWKRDAVLISLPILAGFPAAVIFVVAAGVLAAAMAGASASVTQLGLIVAEDVVGSPSALPRTPGARLMASRGAIALVALLAGWGAIIARGDPLDLMLWSLAISASALFPVLLLSIWWKRVNAWGAIAGIAAGLGAAISALLAGAAAQSGAPTILAAAIGVPVSLASAIAVSLLTPAAGRHTLEMVRDLRVPGGETVYDRELRHARQRRPGRR